MIKTKETETYVKAKPFLICCFIKHVLKPTVYTGKA